MSQVNAKPQARSIQSNFVWTLAGYAVYAACQWGMLVALAKLGSPGMVGQFALGLAITAPLLMFTNLQLRSVLATDCRGEFDFPDYLGLRVTSTLLALLALPVIALCSQCGGGTFVVVLLVGVAKGFESVSDVYFGRLQQHERMQPIAQSLITKGLLSLAVFWVALWLTHNLMWACAGLIVAWALVLFLYDVPVSRQAAKGSASRPRFSARVLGRLAWRSLPLGVMSMLVSLQVNIPRYFIEGHLGAAALGIFAALVYPMTAGTFVVTALGQAALPVLARHFAARDAIGRPFLVLLTKISAGGLLLGGSGVLLCLGAGRQLLLAFYRPEYAQHVDVLIWLAVAASLNYVATFLNAGVTATREFHVLTVPYILQAIVALGMSAVLVARFGLVGAAWASCGISALGCAIPLVILVRIRMRHTVKRPASPRRITVGRVVVDPDRA